MLLILLLETHQAPLVCGIQTRREELNESTCLDEIENLKDIKREL